MNNMKEFLLEQLKNINSTSNTIRIPFRMVAEDSTEEILFICTFLIKRLIHPHDIHKALETQDPLEFIKENFKPFAVFVDKCPDTDIEKCQILNPIITDLHGYKIEVSAELNSLPFDIRIIQEDFVKVDYIPIPRYSYLITSQDGIETKLIETHINEVFEDFGTVNFLQKIFALYIQSEKLQKIDEVHPLDKIIKYQLQKNGIMSHEVSLNICDKLLNVNAIYTPTVMSAFSYLKYKINDQNQLRTKSLNKINAMLDTFVAHKYSKSDMLMNCIDTLTQKYAHINLISNGTELYTDVENKANLVRTSIGSDELLNGIIEVYQKEIKISDKTKVEAHVGTYRDWKYSLVFITDTPIQDRTTGLVINEDNKLDFTPIYVILENVRLSSRLISTSPDLFAAILAKDLFKVSEMGLDRIIQHMEFKINNTFDVTIPLNELNIFSTLTVVMGNKVYSVTPLSLTSVGFVDYKTCNGGHFDSRVSSPQLAIPIETVWCTETDNKEELRKYISLNTVESYDIYSKNIDNELRTIDYKTFLDSLNHILTYVHDNATTETTRNEIKETLSFIHTLLEEDKLMKVFEYMNQFAVLVALTQIKNLPILDLEQTNHIFKMKLAFQEIKTNVCDLIKKSIGHIKQIDPNTLPISKDVIYVSVSLQYIKRLINSLHLYNEEHNVFNFILKKKHIFSEFHKSPSELGLRVHGTKPISEFINVFLPQQPNSLYNAVKLTGIDITALKIDSNRIKFIIKQGQDTVETILTFSEGMSNQEEKYYLIESETHNYPVSYALIYLFALTVDMWYASTVNDYMLRNPVVKQIELILEEIKHIMRYRFLDNDNMFIKSEVISNPKPIEKSKTEIKKYDCINEK